MKINLGHSENPANHIKFDDPSVSFEHAQLYWDEEGNLYLEDKGSTNGVRKNNLAVFQSLVRPEDSFQIGYQRVLGKELLRLAKPFRFPAHKMEFISEFEKVEKAFVASKKAEKKVKGAFRTKVNILRVGFTLGLMLLFIAFGESWGMGAEWRIIVPMIGASLIMPFADRFFGQDALNEQLQLIRKQYADELCCPKCGIELADKPLSYWKEKRRCAKCHAVWLE